MFNNYLNFLLSTNNQRREIGQTADFRSLIAANQILKFQRGGIYKKARGVRADMKKILRDIFCNVQGIIPKGCDDKWLLFVVTAYMRE